MPGRIAVIGGGLAGVAAATVLAERGLDVTLVEREPHLGGRVAAWTEALATGDRVEMERGFHAFFRQYYNVRALLRRVDPSLSSLAQLHDYPILGPDGATESFADLPFRPPFNIIGLVRRTRSLRLRDLVRVDKRAALEMLRFERRRTYAQHDHRTAREYLDSLRFPEKARRMLFEVFAHSFFNPEEHMSAAELLMMFHFYFMGNPEGLVFDVLKEPFSTAVWTPFRHFLEGLRVDLRLATSALHVEPGFQVRLGDGSTLAADAVVLALSVPALKAVVAESPALGTPAWRAAISDLSTTRPFAVWRLWLDGPLRPDRAPFAGTAGCGLLDNISVYDRFEGESRRWAERTGGSVVELHAYAVPEDLDEAAIRQRLWEPFLALYPEAAQRRVLDERFLLRADCPAFAPGSDATRPTVDTPIANLFLAGDFVRLDIPTALMERAVTSGFQAANAIARASGLPEEPIAHIPERGWLARG